MFITHETYAYYYRSMKVTVSSSGSDIKCNAFIEDVANEEKSIFGYSEFKVRVTNYEGDDLTSEPISYSITFENVDGDAIYGTDNEFDSDLVINGTMGNSSEENDSYIIQVKSTSGSSETINYKVNVNCKQQY